MNEVWEKLYNEALSVLNPRKISPCMCIGSVAAAVLTKSGTIYTGICIDTDSSLGMCAERNALSTMLTHSEYEVLKVVAVYKDGTILPPCGACREFMTHLGESAKDIEILLSQDGRTAKLIDLMPEYPL